MTRSPLFRACAALRLPRGLYCLRGDLPLSDAEIRRALRKQHVGAERLVLALADVLAGPDLALDEPVTDVWQLAAAVVKERDLPASMVGALALAAMLPEEGVVEPDELGFWMEAAP
jgi:hypothetical protein